MLVRRAFKYRAYPTVAQARLLTEQLGECARLYNAALQERRDAWRMQHAKITLYSQIGQLKDIRSADDIGVPNFNAAMEVLFRVDRAFQGFFRRVKAKTGRAGYPRFRSARRYDSITFEVGHGAKLMPIGRLRLHGIGRLRLKLHRPPEGELKTATVKREGHRWYAILVAEVEAVALAPSSAEVGIDVGLTSFATLSDGATIDNPRFLERSTAKVRRAARRVSRRRRRSIRRRVAVDLLRSALGAVARQRADFQHKLSRQIVNGYGLIAVEDLNVKGLAGGMLARPVNDASWGAFLARLSYKAESAEREFVKVDPRGTSQRCPCGAAVPKRLKDRWHKCGACGLSTARDHASALEILRLGRSLRPLREAS